MHLDGRHVVVTGSTGGLGGAVVERLRAQGATCHLPGVDLTVEDEVARYYASVPPLWGSVHLAGGFAAGPLLDTPLGQLRAQLDLNLVTAFLCCREAVRNMRARAPGAGGRLVNVCARPALVPARGMVAYATSKGAVATLTTSLAQELQGDGILVNAIVPSIIDTPANRAAMPSADYSRWPKPTELASVVGWMLSPEATVTTGALVPVYGRA